MAKDELLKQATEALGKATKMIKDGKAAMEKERQEMIERSVADLAKALKPVLESLAEASKINAETITKAVKEGVSQAKIEFPEIPAPNVTVEVPDVHVPKIEVPKAEITVKVPPIDPPIMPDEMEIRGWVGLMGYDKSFLSNPLPVQLRDQKGAPLDFASLFGRMVVQQSGGGGFRHVIVDNYSQIGGSGGLTDAELRASALQVIQLSGSAFSVSATEYIRVDQVSGANFSVFVTGSSGTTSAVGDVAHGGDDLNSYPVKVGGQGRQTNPTPVSDGARTHIITDDLGRQLTRMQARDLLQTAYASVTTGTETTLKAGVVGSYLDLIYVLASNNSTVAVGIDLRQVSGGSIVMHLEIPANGVVGVSLPAPLPQGETGNDWTVDMPDITGTTVNVSALFSKEI